MAFVPQDSYDDDDEDAPKSPEEEFEMMYGDAEMCIRDSVITAKMENLGSILNVGVC